MTHLALAHFFCLLLLHFMPGPCKILDALSFFTLLIKMMTTKNINKPRSILTQKPACLVRETELRQLRKASAEYEEQNSALRKHVETLQAAVSRLEAETEQQRRHSAALQHHLDSLRDVLANSFAHLPLPGDHSSSFRIYSDLRMDHQMWKY